VAQPRRRKLSVQAYTSREAVTLRDVEVVAAKCEVVKDQESTSKSGSA
jgi:hypothetical protein